jgi:hypothetical protein
MRTHRKKNGLNQLWFFLRTKKWAFLKEEDEALFIGKENTCF